MSSISRRKSETSSKQTEFSLQQKVKSLETEVKALKNKLEELRKAKNTVILKHEKEFVSTTNPSLSNKRSLESSNSNANGISKADLSSEIENLRQTHQQRITQLEDQLSKNKIDTSNEQPCGHEEVITALQNRLAETESMNSALSLQCQQYQERLDQLYEVQSTKEVEYAKSTEKLKVELQVKWKKMYEDWMQTTEAKLGELQAANDMLRSMLSHPS